MYHHLKGQITDKQQDSIVLEIAGIGYELKITSATHSELPDQDSTCLVYIHEVLRENEHTLYAFATREERSLFENLLRVSSIGPAGALQILSQSHLPRLVQAIANGDSAYLQTLKGVGKKSAERIILELRDRLSIEGLTIEAAAKSSLVNAAYPEDALKALLVLGLTPEMARQRLQNVADLDKNGKSKDRNIKDRETQEWIRLALKHG